MFEYKINKDLSLRLVHVLDSEEVYQLIDESRAHLKKWLTWVDLIKSVRDCRYSALKAMDQYAENNGFQCNIIYSGKIVGRIGLHGINWGDKSTSIGYWLGKKYVGRGIMTTCCDGLLKLVFNQLKLNKVYIYVDEKNTKSRAIPKRLNFKEVSIKNNAQIFTGSYVKHVRYIMTRERYFQPY
ncbi:GNAT family N-acetyltransferase [Vallitalea pronyensis]|uniref:GNAT family N-acetyltransferase n=1 Tax=Vallitalea pronyensis TaxID=1348613 RepID=A0A8J8SH69_9FIRM|nr:GNAT family protein [Vallitalea pronyensis]QUI23291.1 GNAT family N-acetyltransferase [Vallitalea pronyensis]